MEPSASAAFMNLSAAGRASSVRGGQTRLIGGAFVAMQAMPVGCAVRCGGKPRFAGIAATRR
jgi:hypothetical protein